MTATEPGGQSRDSVFCLQGNGIDRSDTAGCNGKGWTQDVCYTLNTIDRPAIAFAQNQRNEVRDLHDIAGCLSSEPGMKQQTYVCAGFDGKMGAQARNIGYEPEKAPTLNAQKEMHVYDARGNGDGSICPTLTGDHQNRVTDYTALVAHTLKGKSACDFREDSETYVVTAVDCRNGTENPDVNGTLQAKSTGGMSVNLQNVCRQGAVVRRLTPLECERLQGFPDGWTDIGDWTDSKGKHHKAADSPRYKALGNSIALPFWQWMARRICAQYERTATMGSLFDGIGGFPLVFSRCGATPIWASEIEEFPIAVTKIRFPEREMEAV